MEIQKENDNLIIKIPLFQSGESQWGNKWKVQNLIAVKTWDKKIDDWDYTISQAIYLDYKDDIQEGEPIIHLSKEDFYKFAALLKLETYEHRPCSICKEPIYGSFTMTEKGDSCFNCEEKEAET